MKVARSADLMYQTYFMVDWKATEQSPSELPCIQCGAKMKSVVAVSEDDGATYEGLVCHSCKRVVWVKTGRKGRVARP